MHTASYPPCIVVVDLSFVQDLWNSPTRVLAPVMLVSLLFGMVDAFKGSSLAHVLPDFMAHLPLSDAGMAWLVPSVVTLVGAVACNRMLGKQREVLA